jgi:hypothetical protein
LGLKSALDEESQGEIDSINEFVCTAPIMMEIDGSYQRIEKGYKQ